MSGIIMYDLNKDFVEIKDLYLESEDIGVKIAISRHAKYRMEDCEDRYCDCEDVENLVIARSEKILDLKSGDDFLLISDDKKLSVVCEMYVQNGNIIIVIKTVINTILMGRNFKLFAKNRKSIIIR